MSIHFDEESGQFHLRAGQCSYVLQLLKGRWLIHRYLGPALAGEVLALPMTWAGRPSFSANPLQDDGHLSTDTVPQEFPWYGSTDLRQPAIEVLAPSGASTLDLRYAQHRILDGKPRLTGLPSTYVEQDSEAQTLEIDLVDALLGLRVTLSFTAWVDHSVIARSVRVHNEGDQPLRLRRLLSLSVDLPDDQYDYVQLAGTWARERHVQRGRLSSGEHRLESRRGASSHALNPYLALVRPETTETSGDAIGVTLVYSGNFMISADVDPYRTTRVLVGINPFDFEWLLQPGEGFQAPEALLAFSSEGLTGLSQTWHRLLRTRLARGAHRDRIRPVLINNWEATYFSFDRDTLVELARSAADLGISLFVLDDGWFGHRDNDHSSLGDWRVDPRKLPGGLGDLAQEIKGAGMQMGLWFEPEMISPDSDLYRAHPDWCLHVDGRGRSQARNQLILDFSRADVRDAITQMLREVLQSAPIAYVKWDMNRNMTEIGSAALPPERQRETAHRYMLGLYEVLEQVTSEFPEILFESCSGGGGRFDAGMLHYMPQTWTSDDTDAIARLAIQFGTSMIYPASAMGAHVSAVPNHQVQRVTPLATRGLVAMMGNFGYELDVRRLTAEERAEIRAQIELYKEIQPLILAGDLYRLWAPEAGQRTAWMYVTADQREAVVTVVQVLAEPNPPVQYLRLRGLHPQQEYAVTLVQTDDRGHLQTPVALYQARGDELQGIGLVIPHLAGDFRGALWRLRGV